MLELLFIGLYQVAAGEPATPTAPQSQHVTQIGSNADTGVQRVRERNRRRCTVDTVTGSRLGARVCQSQAEYEALEREARDLLQDHMRIADDR